MKRMIIGLAIAVAGLLSAPAHADALTNFGENRILDAVVRGQTLSAPATWHMGLSTDICNDATAGAEPSGGAYTRVAVTASLAEWAGTQGAGTTSASSGTGATTSNNSVITWPESTAAWGVLQSVQWWDAASGGNRWICINLAAPFDVSAAGVTVRLPAGALQFYVDN